VRDAQDSADLNGLLLEVISFTSDQ